MMMIDLREYNARLIELNNRLIETRCERNVKEKKKRKKKQQKLPSNFNFIFILKMNYCCCCCFYFYCRLIISIDSIRLEIQFSTHTITAIIFLLTTHTTVRHSSLSFYSRYFCHYSIESTSIV